MLANNTPPNGTPNRLAKALPSKPVSSSALPLGNQPPAKRPSGSFPLPANRLDRAVDPGEATLRKSGLLAVPPLANHAPQKTSRPQASRRSWQWGAAVALAAVLFTAYARPWTLLTGSTTDEAVASLRAVSVEAAYRRCIGQRCAAGYDSSLADRYVACPRQRLSGRLASRPGRHGESRRAAGRDRYARARPGTGPGRSPGPRSRRGDRASQSRARRGRS